MKVFVYYNLHKHLFSIKSLQGSDKGRVIAHINQLVIENALFKVSETGRKRVIREQRKNVHAGVMGYWYQDRKYNTEELITEVTYNPYKYDSFVTVEDLTAVYTASIVFLVDRKVFI